LDWKGLNTIRLPSLYKNSEGYDVTLPTFMTFGVLGVY
jgi:hypothetical protein